MKDLNKLVSRKELYLGLLSISIFACAAIGWLGLATTTKAISPYLTPDTKFSSSGDWGSPTLGPYWGFRVHNGHGLRIDIFAAQNPQTKALVVYATSGSGFAFRHYNLILEGGIISYEGDPLWQSVKIRP